MKLIYIAGPFTAPTPWGIENNIRLAEEVAEFIIKERPDLSVLVPHSIGRHFVGRVGTAEYWYAATMRMLEACDGVVLCHNWKTSSGARKEFVRAVDLGIPVYESPINAVSGLPMHGATVLRLLKEIEEAGK